MIARRVSCLAFALFVGCGARRAQREPVPRDTSPVVARVNGEPVTADEVSAMARAEHLDARAALDRVVNHRLLVREGLRSGLLVDDDVENARWHGAVQAVIAREVEDRESERTIPREFLDAYFQHRRVEFMHEGLVEVVHALAQVEGTPPSPQALAEARAKIAAFRQRIVAEGGSSPPRETFERIGREMQLRVEALAPFDRTGQTPDDSHYVAPFVAAAWSLTPDAPLSQPFETTYGAHVALRVGGSPPLHRPLDEVRAILVRDGVALRRTVAMRRLLEGLRARVDVRVNETAIATPSHTAGP